MKKTRMIETLRANKGHAVAKRYAVLDVFVVRSQRDRALEIELGPTPATTRVHRIAAVHG
jgi:hypothetical protein